MTACGGTRTSAPDGPQPSAAALPGIVSTDELATWMRGGPVVLVDIRTDVFAYLRGHLPGAAYLNPETLRATRGGIPTRLLDGSTYGVLFAGDVLVEDGVSMVVDGNADELLRVLDRVDSMHAAIVVPGHGAIPRRPAKLVQRTREYLTGLQAEMRAAVEKAVPMRRALAALPPADSTRPVSLNSRRRRNAARVYVEEERKYMGLDEP